MIDKELSELGLSRGDLLSLSKLVGTPFIGYLASSGVFIGENGKTFWVYKKENTLDCMTNWIHGNYDSVEDFYAKNRVQVQKALRKLGSKAVSEDKVAFFVRSVGIAGFCEFSGIARKDFDDTLHKEALELYLSDKNGATFESFAKRHGAIGEDGRVKLNSSVLDDFAVIPAVLDELSDGDLSQIFSDNPASTRYIISDAALARGEVSQDTVIVERKIGFSLPLCKVGGHYYSDEGTKEALKTIVWSDDHQDWLLSSKCLKTAKDVVEQDPLYVVYAKSADGYFKYKDKMTRDRITG